MSKNKTDRMIDDVFEKCVCANECTGLYQKVSPDPREVRYFHKLFNGEDDE